MTDFEREVAERLAAVKAHAPEMERAAHQFIETSFATHYSYNFFWQGRPIIQYPQDIMAMQELIWQVKPDLIIETGIADRGWRSPRPCRPKASHSGYRHRHPRP